MAAFAKSTRSIFLLASLAIWACGEKEEEKGAVSALPGHWHGTMTDIRVGSTAVNQSTKVDMQFEANQEFKMNAPLLGKHLSGEYLEFSGTNTMTLEYRGGHLDDFGLVGGTTENFEFQIEGDRMLLRSNRIQYALKRYAADEAPKMGLQGHWQCRDEKNWTWALLVDKDTFNGTVSKDDNAPIYIRGSVTMAANQNMSGAGVTSATLAITDAAPIKPYESLRAELQGAGGNNRRLQLVPTDGTGALLAGAPKIACKPR